jgi:hypothetical protein
MTPKAKNVAAALLLALLALPTGLCSLIFTPMGIGSSFGRDALERAIGSFALVCCAIGWTICGLTISGAFHPNRVAKLERPPRDTSP